MAFVFILTKFLTISIFLGQQVSSSGGCGPDIENNDQMTEIDSIYLTSNVNEIILDISSWFWSSSCRLLNINTKALSSKHYDCNGDVPWKSLGLSSQPYQYKVTIATYYPTKPIQTYQSTDQQNFDLNDTSSEPTMEPTYAPIQFSWTENDFVISVDNKTIIIPSSNFTDFDDDYYTYWYSKTLTSLFIVLENSDIFIISWRTDVIDNNYVYARYDNIITTWFFDDKQVQPIEKDLSFNVVEGNWYDCTGLIYGLTQYGIDKYENLYNIILNDDFNATTFGFGYISFNYLSQYFDDRINRSYFIDWNYGYNTVRTSITYCDYQDSKQPICSTIDFTEKELQSYWTLMWIGIALGLICCKCGVVCWIFAKCKNRYNNYSDNNKKIKRIEEMGFDRESIQFALEMNNNDVEMAVLNLSQPIN